MWSTSYPGFLVARFQSHGVEFLAEADEWCMEPFDARVFCERNTADQARRRLSADAVLPSTGLSWLKPPMVLLSPSAVMRR